MNKDQKLLSLIYSSFTNENNVLIEEVYTADKDLVKLRQPIRAMTDEMEAIMYSIAEYIEFDGEDKIVQ